VNENKWSITGEGEMNFAALGIQIPTKTTETGGQTREVYDFRNISSSSIKPGLNGFGLAFDLGVLYKAPFAEGLEFSASVLDLGFASWSDANIGKMVGVWNFEGFKFGKGQKEFKDQWEQLGEELEDCFMFEPTGKTTKTNALSATMNLGVAYALPCYKRLKFGFLSSTRFNGPYTTSEGRFSANINPYGGLDIGVNYAITSFGSSFGWIVNVAQKGFNFYIGMDHTLGKVSKQFAPISGRSSLSLGISFPITSRKI
ncbi:MAG: hypothetical protein HUK03_07185, partial [Bacteroidaceae bacterium]|nr:hypothetical protein [Bacteroidaceae bacterium]